MKFQNKIFILFITLLLKTIYVFGNTKQNFEGLGQCFLNKITEKNLIEKKVFLLLEEECNKNLKQSNSRLEKNKKETIITKKKKDQIKIIFPEGEIYEGGWDSGKKNGFGTFTYSDGSKYIGEWKYGLKDGNGIKTYPDGRKYIGQWINGEINGQGTYLSPFRW